MRTTEANIWLALRRRLEALEITPDLPVLWPGESTELPQVGSPPWPAPCLEVIFLPNRNRRLFLKGANAHQHIGILQVGLLTLPGAEHHETFVQDVGGKIAAHFPAGLALYSEGVKVTISEKPGVGGSFRDEQRNRWVTPVAIRYSAFA